MKQKERLLVIFTVIIMLLLGAVGLSCVIHADAAQDNPIKIWLQNESGPYETLNVVDEKTGVNYIVVSRKMPSNSVSVSICPRYNADGSLYVGP